MTDYYSMQNNYPIKQVTNTTSKYVVIRNMSFIMMLGFLVYHLFPFPPIVWRMGLVFLSIGGLYVHLREFKLASAEKSMLGFVVLNIVYFFFSMLWQVPDFTNFGNVLCATLPMFLFFVLSAHGAITSRSLVIFLLLSTALGYFYFDNAEKIMLDMYLYGEAGAMTVNASTIFLVIIPLLFFVRKRWLQIPIVLVIVFFVIFGAKRGNIVSMVIPLYLLFQTNNRSKNSIFSEIVVIISFVALGVFAYYLMIENEYVMSRVEETMEGNSSHRDMIYAAAFNKWIDADYLHNYLFGFGTDGTMNTIKIRAHNDWLEILVDFGMLGFVFYLSFFIGLIKTAWQNKENRRAFYTLFAVISIWFSKSLYSMGFTETLFCYLSMVIGVVLGDLSRPKDKRILVSN